MMSLAGEAELGSARGGLPGRTEAPSPGRRDRWRLRDRLRRAQPTRRHRDCGVRRIAEHADLRRSGKTAWWEGLLTCGSVWACPTCAAARMEARAQEAGTLVRWAEEHGYACIMATYTIRHYAHHDLAPLLEGLNRAHSAVISGAPWRRRAEAWGVVGRVRAVEVTVGRHGWHPHIHELLVVPVERVDDVMSDGWDWLGDRWATMVERHLGAEHVPSEAHGVHLLDARADAGGVARYIHDLGLDPREIAGSTSTSARASSSRSIWQLAQTVPDDPADRRLWHEWVAASRGRRQMMWSRGLRALCGAEAAAEQLAERRAELRATSDVVLELAAGPWARISVHALHLLERAEDGQTDAELRALASRLDAVERSRLDVERSSAAARWRAETHAELAAALRA